MNICKMRQLPLSNLRDELEVAIENGTTHYARLIRLVILAKLTNFLEDAEMNNNTRKYGCILELIHEFDTSFDYLPIEHNFSFLDDERFDKDNPDSNDEANEDYERNEEPPF